MHIIRVQAAISFVCDDVIYIMLDLISHLLSPAPGELVKYPL